MRVTPELLHTFPCLKALPDQALHELAQHSKAERYARREVVLNAGEIEPSVCFLFEGHLQGIDFTIDGREVGLYFVEPGDFCGELGMFDEGPQPEYVIARTAATVVFVPISRLREIAREHGNLLGTLAGRLANRFRQMTQQRALLGLPNVGQRVCCQLWMLLPPSNRETLHKVVLSNPPTHMEIAIMLNLSREAVSRVFQTLQAREVVQRDGPGKLLVNKPELLRDYAEGREKC